MVDQKEFNRMLATHNIYGINKTYEMLTKSEKLRVNAYLRREKRRMIGTVEF